MKWLRAVGAIVLGYVVCQGLNGAHVYFWYVQDRPTSGAFLVPWTVLGFALVGVATGYLTERAGGALGRACAWWVAALVAAVTVGNIVVDVAAEPLWHKLIVLLVMAPAIVASAEVVTRRRSSGTDHAPNSE